MTVIELKKKIINRIKTIDDDEFLQEIFNFIEIEEGNSDVYKLSEKELLALKEAGEQYQKGNYQSSEKADKQIDEWLEV